MKTTALTSFDNPLSGNRIHPDEANRLRALRSYNLLEAPPEEAFQALVHLIAEHFEVPVAFISLVEQEEVFFLAGVGWNGVRSVSRNISLSAHAVLNPKPTILEEPMPNSGFCSNPLVNGSAGLSFFAAAPLTTSSGYPIGAICLADKAHRRMPARQKEQLMQFAKLVMQEIELRHAVQLREKELEKETRQRQKLITDAVIQAQEKERNRIGLELHDNVSQILTTVKLYTEVALHEGGNTKEILQQSSRFLQTCINEIRFLTKQLSPPTAGCFSLQDTLRELIQSINVTQKVRIFFTAEGLENLQNSRDFHLCVYRIVQEQLNNILKHAGATEVQVAVRQDASGLALQIKDNGKGFDTGKKSAGIGITNMRTRAESFEGRFSLESRPGHGCRLRVDFPLHENYPLAVQN